MQILINTEICSNRPVADLFYYYFFYTVVMSSPVFSSGLTYRKLKWVVWVTVLLLL